MSLNRFTSTVWSETLYKELQKNYVGVKLCNREFEGEIKGQGDRVKICGIGPISVFNYSKNTDMPAAEVLSDNERTLIIDQAKGFNFFIDDVDAAQARPNIMTEAMSRASDALADVADSFVYSLEDDNVASLTNADTTAASIISTLAEARLRLMENNVPNTASISLEVPPAIEQKLVLAKVLHATDNTAAISKGYVGSFMGFDVYVSNNIPKSGDSYKCIARTNRAIAFAEQINSVTAYEPELRHGDAIKGLHLYGAKIIYPGEMVFLHLTPGEESAI
ncbi:MAG: hypothetical protein IJC94_04155 [Oscillospiraceae bacterium]|nr:hypothetical protein [Oscillospiraceae bacterium]